MKAALLCATALCTMRVVTCNQQDNHIVNTHMGKQCNVSRSSTLKNCILGNNVTVNDHCSIENCTIGDNTVINSHCSLKDSTIESEAKIGPFAHISEKSTIRKSAAIGTFVQVKRSEIGEGTKAMHLAYLGDARIGKCVNIGAGTVLCNYNGVSKHATYIQDNAFIGSNTTIIAPRTIGKGAFVAAGSVITKDIPEESLAIERATQINKDGYAPTLRERYRQLAQQTKAH